MKKAEIECFIRDHTREFEHQMTLKRKRITSFPNEGYAKTAEINLQRRCDFNQHEVIQQKWMNLVNYIITVNRL